MPTPKTIYLAISLDVEEEGLFQGSYAQKEVTVKNTRALLNLKPFLKEGLRPTLFTAYPVFKDPRSVEILHLLQEEGCEIGAHLHYWNTPPIPTLDLEKPLTKVPAVSLDQELFSAKIDSILDAAKKANFKELNSFRMGRWDIHSHHFAALSKAKFLVDASVRPLHGTTSKDKQPDHFKAMASPYWIPTREGLLFEVPLTVTPLTLFLPGLLNNLEALGLKSGIGWLKSRMNYWGALALLPVYQPLIMLKIITLIYLARGGQVLSLTWHSSEMEPGATPHLSSKAQVDKLLLRLHKYLAWLNTNFKVISLHMTELRTLLGAKAPVILADDQSDYSVSTF